MCLRQDEPKPEIPHRPPFPHVPAKPWVSRFYDRLRAGLFPERLHTYNVTYHLTAANRDQMLGRQRRDPMSATKMEMLLKRRDQKVTILRSQLADHFRHFGDSLRDQLKGVDNSRTGMEDKRDWEALHLHELELRAQQKMLSRLARTLGLVDPFLSDLPTS